MRPKRNEVWQVDFGLAGKVRPAVVVSVSGTENDRMIFCIVPHTTSLQGSQFEVALAVSFLQPGAFLTQGITNFALSRFDRRLGTLNLQQMSLVEDGLRRLLGL